MAPDGARKLTPLPRGSGSMERAFPARTRWEYSAMRTTPAWRSIPSTMRSGEAMAAVWATAACRPASVAPLFKQDHGFLSG